MNEYNEQAVETLDDAGCIIANKNIIIDNLQARIAELEAENARLKREDFSHERIQNDTLKLQNRVLYEKMIEAQAYAEQLREAFENHSGNYKLSKAECKIINDLLDKPHDTSALDAYVAEKVKEAMK